MIDVPNWKSLAGPPGVGQGHKNGNGRGSHRHGHNGGHGLIRPTGPGATAGLPLIDVRAVSKAYRTPAGEVPALVDIDLQIRPGEFVAVVGKSGAGKSTLINVLTGIDRPTTGQVRVGPQALHEMSEDRLAAWRGKNVGVIFQFFQLLPALTCAQNVMLPMDFAGLYRSPRERRERALHLLEQVGIPEQADKLPSAVSGGQRQRVAIARALANDPTFLAADEPTGNLDSKTAHAVFRVFERLIDEGTTIVMVTHDRDLAARAGRLLRIADGRIVEDSGNGDGRTRDSGFWKLAVGEARHG